MKRCLFVLIVLLGASTAQAQMVMSANVKPDRIIVGAEFVSRCLYMPRVLTVPFGTTTELDADSTFDCIEVSGTLRVSRTHDTILHVTTLIVLPMGHLDCGTQADPMPAGIKVTFVIRDVPIDVTRDPFKWGNALLSFGRNDRVGAKKLTWTTLTSGVAAGSTSVTLPEDPIGWRVGDALKMPDTVQTAFPNVPRQEGPLTVAAIAGRTVTLNKPLDFDHLDITDVDGNVVLHPRLANLTRNIVITSENPLGTPGHSANIGADATWDIEYNEFDNLGRTKNITLDDTKSCTADTPAEVPGRTWTCAHLGTNPRARYSDHDHMGQGFGSITLGNAHIGRGLDGISAKWCHSVHGVSDSLVADNVCTGFPGSGIVTEDGYEVRNRFSHNIVFYSVGNHTEDRNIEVGNAETNNPGAAGSCFWFRGVKNYFDGNEAWNCTIGINLFNQDLVPGSYPSVPGGPKDTPILTYRSDAAMVPLSFTNNVTAANTVDGLEYWSIAKFPVVNLISANNGQMQVFQSQSVLAEPYLVNPTIVAQGGLTTGIQAGVPYVASLTIEGGSFSGCLSAVIGGGQVVTLKNVRLQCALNLDFGNIPQQAFTLDNVMHVPMPGRPPQYIRLGDDASVWNGVLPLPAIGGNSLRDQLGSRFLVKNWQNTGQNLQLFPKQSLGSTPAWPSKDPWPYLYLCPEFPITTAQCYDRYGMAWFGEAVNDADTVPLTGLVSGYARPGLTPHFGPPRAVVTFPTMRAPAVTKLDANNGNLPYIDYYGLVTGDPNGGNTTVLVSVDGGPVETARNTDGSTWHYWTYKVSPGTHEIRSWRVDNNGTPIEPPQVRNFPIGAVTPPTCNPPNVVVNGKCVPPPPTCPTFTVIPTTFSAQVGVPIKAAPFTTTGGVAPFTFKATGSLPAGVTITPSGLPTGTPTTAGSFVSMVQATDVSACVGSASVTMAVAPAPPPPPTPSLLPAGSYTLCRDADKLCASVVVK